MFLPELFRKRFAGAVAVALTCSFTAASLSSNAAPGTAGDAKSLTASGDKPVAAGDAKPVAARDAKPVAVGNAKPVPGADLKPVTAGDAKSETKSDVTEGTRGDTVNTAAEVNAKSETENTSTGGGVTAKEASLITPLESAVQDEEFFANQSRQQIALMQQHQAVQHYDASKYYSKINDLELAELELRSAIMYMPSLKIAHRDYCLVAFMRGKPMRSFAEFLMVLGLCEPIPLTEQQQQELRVEAAQVHYKRGVEKAQKSDWNEAISELLWSRTYLPNDIAIHRSLAFAYAGKGDFKRAEEYYESTFSIDPSDAFAHADFAYLLDKNGKKDEAMAEMAKAVKVDPDSTALHVDLAWLAQSKGDLAKAENEFRAALKNSPQYSPLWYQLGQLLEKRGDKAEAKVAYVTALQKEPSNTDAKTALALLGGAGAATEVSAPSGAPATAKTETVGPASAKPDAAKTDAVKTDAAKPVSVKPADSKPRNAAGGGATPTSDTSKQTAL